MPPERPPDPQPSFAAARNRRRGEHAPADLLDRIAHIDVPPGLLRDILLGQADPLSARQVPSGARQLTGTIAMWIAGHPADVVLAARLRLRALVCVLQDLFPCGAADDEADVVLVHDDMFMAAAREPLIPLTDGDIGFDPEGLRSRLVRIANGRGGACS